MSSPSSSTLLCGQYLTLRLSNQVTSDTSFALDLVSLREVLVQRRPLLQAESDLILSVPSSPFILSPLRKIGTENAEHLVFASRGNLTLSRYLRQFGGLNELRASKFFYQICQALIHLQASGLTSRSLTADKIIILPSFSIALFDFQAKPDSDRTNVLLTKSQLKELGILLLTMLGGSKDFSEQEIYQICFQDTLDGDDLSKLPSEELKILLKRLFFGDQELTNIQDLLQTFWILNNSCIFSTLTVSAEASLRDYKGYFIPAFPPRVWEHRERKNVVRRLINFLCPSRDEEPGQFVRKFENKMNSAVPH